MAIFVDSVGLNTLVSSSFDDSNTLTSNRNAAIATIPPEEVLVGINIHRNGPYGYSSWKQLRVSENPVTRNHRETNKMTFVVQPGPMSNLLSNGDLRVRDRYSALYSFTEPAVTQKAYPLVWNVGRHFKDEDGNVDFENPQRFSIISSYGNQQIAFANDEVSKLHKFDPDEEKTEYVTIKDMYLENGLNKQDSPLTHWEFLQYRETIFPKATQQFVSQTRTRPQFVSFFRHDRALRTNQAVNTFKFGNSDTSFDNNIYKSSWPLDAQTYFLTRLKNMIEAENGIGTWRVPESQTLFNRYNTGILQNVATQFSKTPSTPMSPTNAADFNGRMTPGPLYNRRISLTSSLSVSNPSGMEVYGTASQLQIFMGDALWEAGDKRQIKNDDGTYTSAPKQPFYDTYENYVEDVRKFGKNYSILPEFRMSSQVEDYLKTDGEIETDMFEVTGGVSDSENSSKSDFYEIYSNTDFMKNFEVISDDHEDFTNGKVLSLRCKAIKKFLPYEGFYPCQRTVDLSKRFFDSFKEHIDISSPSTYNADSDIKVQIGRQPALIPLFAPGILFNTIKSGVAVDYPIITGSLSTAALGDEYLITNDGFDKRIPFEALIKPADYLADYQLTVNEPHPSGNLQSSALWDGQGDSFYSMMANNFLAESINFFLPNGQLSSVVSKQQKDIRLVSGRVYGMRVKMKKSMSGSRGFVSHFNSSSLPYFPPQDIKSGSLNNKETFTMYSRPSAFGPPTQGTSELAKTNTNLDLATLVVNKFDLAGRFLERTSQAGSNRNYFYDGAAIQGYNFPFTPPYYHGEAWCHITFTASSDNMTIKEIQSSSSYEYTRYDSSFFSVTSSASSGQLFLHTDFTGIGPQAWANDNINKNAVQLSSSLNIEGIGTINKKGSAGSAGSFVVDSGLEEESRWVIQTKFETPMLNFNHISGSDHLTLPIYGSGSVPRGMWHQYGRKPESKEGVFLQVGPIPDNYQTQVMKKTTILSDMAEALGFSGVATKLGRLASRKEISEAVVAIPFIKEEGKRRFFKLDKDKVDTYKAGPNAGALAAAKFNALTGGSPESQIGRSVLDQIEKMKKYIFPPSFDFMNFDTDNVAPIAMYIFEFSHTLTQTDLQDIWQNLPPDIGTEMEVAEVAITHPLLKKELLGPGGEGGNDTIEMSDKLKWMVFKVKQRAANNYFKKTVLRNPEVNTDVESGNVTQDEFGKTSTIQYNWPYDFFSLVEMVRIDSEVEMGNADFSEYTDNLPSWDAVQADRDKIEYIVGGLEDEPIPEIVVPDDSEGIPVGSDAPGGQPTNRLSILIQKSISLSNQVYNESDGATLALAARSVRQDVYAARNGWTESDAQYLRSSEPWRDWWEEFINGRERSGNDTFEGPNLDARTNQGMDIERELREAMFNFTGQTGGSDSGDFDPDEGGAQGSSGGIDNPTVEGGQNDDGDGPGGL